MSRDVHYHPYSKIGKHMGSLGKFSTYRKTIGIFNQTLRNYTKDELEFSIVLGNFEINNISVTLEI